MEKDFVPYELAIKLKYLKFDDPCTYSYYQDVSIGSGEGRVNWNVSDTLCSRPLISQAFRWFRDKHRMFHEVFIDTEPTVDDPNKLEFSYLVLHMVGMERMYTDKSKRFDTYEEAELACLDKLIEIVEIELNQNKDE